MEPQRRDKTRVDPLTGAEEDRPAEPLQSVPPGQPANAKTAVIPGTGEVIVDDTGKEVKRVVSSGKIMKKTPISWGRGPS